MLLKLVIGYSLCSDMYCLLLMMIYLMQRFWIFSGWPLLLFAYMTMNIAIK